MKVRRLLLCMFLSLALVVTFIPIVSFADDGDLEGHAVEKVAQSEDDNELASKSDEPDEAIFSAKVTQFSFTPVNTVKEVGAEDDGSYENVWFEDGDIVSVNNVKYKFDSDEYGWYRSNGTELSGEYSIDTIFADYQYFNDGASFQYYVGLYNDETGSLLLKVGPFNAKINSIFKTVWINGLRYELNDGYNSSRGAGVWEIQKTASGHIDVLPNVTLSNGVTYPVTHVSFVNYNISSISIPASVTSMSDVGLIDWDYDEDGNLIDVIVKSGFVIFGTNGTYAQTYAKKYGISFRDLEAERQGTPGGHAKVKISKPKAGKKNITVKWKKLKKKQLKTGVSNIEVWVCTDGAFTRGATIEKFVGKKKGSVKIKGLAKGTYYTKVRAISYVNGVKIVGAWSKVKKVKVKK